MLNACIDTVLLKLLQQVLKVPDYLDYLTDITFSSI